MSNQLSDFEDPRYHMSNDFWNQQQLNGKLPSQHNGAPRSGSLLRDYRHQQQQQGQGIQQNSPLSTPPTYTQGPPPSSPLPPLAGQPHYNGQMPRQQEWPAPQSWPDRKSTRLNSSHSQISYAVFCLKKKN